MISRAGASNGNFHNLPPRPSALVGRRQEIETVRRQLLEADTRLLTLTGPAGVGKTSLAVAAAAELADAYSHGAWFVDLASLADPELVASAVARSIEIQETPDRPILDGLKQHLAERNLLLVLDNFEHVLPAASQVAELLGACPHLGILVTSREPLHLRWERTFAVPPLPLPDLRDPPTTELLAAVPAVALFVERARAVKDDFALTADNAAVIAELCVRLDGLPLAIELAAARANALSPRDILGRLEHRLAILRWDAHDLPARHQTLRSAIAWSYDLLDPPEQSLFRRLSVFAGGCTLEAADGVVSGQWPVVRESLPTDHWPLTTDHSVLDGIVSLVDRSLLRRGEDAGGAARYGMLETIREYALEQLQASEEMAVARGQHAAYFLALAERAEPELRGPNQVAWLRRLEVEHDNLRAALAWAIVERGDPTRGLRLAGALYRFWWRHGHPREGRDWLTRALQHTPSEAVAARAKALNGAAVLARELGDYPGARALFEESLVLYRRLHDSWGTANALTNLGSVAAFQDRPGDAEALLTEALALWHEVGDPWGMAITLGNQSRLAQRQGDLARAEALHQETLALFRRVGDPWGVARFSCSLGRVCYERGERREAAALFAESLPLFRELGEQRGVAECLEGLASLALAAAQARVATVLLGAARAVRDQIQVPLTPHDRASHDRDLSAARQALGESAFAAAWADGQAISIDQAVAHALDVAARESRAAGRDPQARPAGLRLSKREAEVLRLVADGLSNRQIAAALVIAEPTAKFHVASILNKLGADTRAQAVALAAQQGLLHPP